jgi:hypothetical protein
MNEELSNLSLIELKALAYDKHRELLKVRHFILSAEKAFNEISAMISEKENSENLDEARKPEKNKARRG